MTHALLQIVQSVQIKLSQGSQQHENAAGAEGNEAHRHALLPPLASTVAAVLSRVVASVTSRFVTMRDVAGDIMKGVVEGVRPALHPRLSCIYCFRVFV
jgi:hypothetical protein